LAAGSPPVHYHGPRIRYDVPGLENPVDTGLRARPRGRSSAGRKAAAHSYLSVVDGEPARHTTWADCERRVKGRSGARFKKAMSGAEEEAILRSWGFSVDDVR